MDPNTCLAPGKSANTAAALQPLPEKRLGGDVGCCLPTTSFSFITVQYGDGKNDCVIVGCLIIEAITCNCRIRSRVIIMQCNKLRNEM